MVKIFGFNKKEKQTQYTHEGTLIKKISIDLNIEPLHLETIETTDNLPKKCPFCFNSEKKEYVYHYSKDNEVQFISLCNSCGKIFISYFKSETPFAKKIFKYKDGDDMFGKFENISISKSIQKFSSKFYEIYSQAKSGKQMDLYLLIGNSYRKSIEFLIKDYLIKIQKKPEKEIKELNLHKCINQLNFKDDLKNLTKVLKEYGNEETHYEIKTKKNIKKDIEEMENIIEIIIKHVELQLSLNKNSYKLKELN